MFEHILVALDGSKAAEAALGPAAALAGKLGSSLILLHVIERKPPKRVHGEAHLSAPAEASAYLERIAAELSAQGPARGLAIRTHVHEGSAQSGLAATLAAHAGELDFDLAVMAVHGSSGLAERLSASLPLRVAASFGDLSRGDEGASVLVLREGSAASRALPSRVVVPLDGKPEHEASLAKAAFLAKALGLPIKLVTAVPRHGAEWGGAGSALALLSPALSGAQLEYSAKAAREYLEAIAARLRAEGLSVETGIERGRPVRSLIKALAPKADLVVLSTHRRLGIDASLDGCFAASFAASYPGMSLIVPVYRELAR
jgi:nucleotide-binding universal stress UspA family protein